MIDSKRKKKMSERIQQTRFKLSLIGLGLFLFEGMLKVIFPTFPIIEILGAEAGLMVGYITGKSYENGKTGNEE